MLKKRIIPCLDIKNGRTVKGINFEGLRDAGDPLELAKRYVDQGADELVFLDISATNEKRKTLVPLVKEIAKIINIPFTVGGGVSSLSDAKSLINAGADKVTINSSAVVNPSLITQISETFGRQCLVVAIDVNRLDNTYYVFTKGGSFNTDLGAVAWAKKAESLGAGEILLTSMIGDGTKQGFDIPITKIIAQSVNIPVIASGGAGSPSDFVDVFQSTEVSAALAASVFHFGEIAIPDLKSILSKANIPVRVLK